MFLMVGQAQAIQFDVVVLPVDIFNVCDNYFCFPEPSEIVAQDVIDNLNSYKNISAYSLEDVRSRLVANPELKSETETMLDKFAKIDRIDFKPLKNFADEFSVKSVVLISAYVTNEETLTKRNLWEILEVTSAFKIAHTFNLNTNAVLTDTVNNTVMWSSKYSKEISDNNKEFTAESQATSASHLEKIKLYYKDIVSQNIAQNIKLRFFPKDVKTINLQKTEESEKQFIPNALEQLSKPKLQMEFNELEHDENSIDDFMFTL
jgi:hypothetical protein